MAGHCNGRSVSDHSMSQTATSQCVARLKALRSYCECWRHPSGLAHAQGKLAGLESGDSFCVFSHDSVFSGDGSSSVSQLQRQGQRRRTGVSVSRGRTSGLKPAFFVTCSGTPEAVPVPISLPAWGRDGGRELHRSFVGSRPLCVRLRFLRMTSEDQNQRQEQQKSNVPFRVMASSR